MGIFLLLLRLPLCKRSHTTLPPPFFLCSLSLLPTFPLSLSLYSPRHRDKSTFSQLPGLFMGFSCEDVLDEKESEIIFIDETRATQQRNLALMEVHHNHNHEGAENEADFWPVEHPLEPRDEDRPVKCPMPESSVINDEGMHEKKFAESLRKRAEASAAMAEREKTAAMDAEPPAPARAVRKRHHTLTHGDLEITPFMRMPPLPPLPTQNVTVFQMLQQVDKFES